MSVRVSMASLINELRGMCNAGEDDYSVAGVCYWSDEQLQAALDRHRTEVVRDRLVPVEEYNSTGVLTTTRYYSRHGEYEASSGGTAIFVVTDGAHAVIPITDYTPDYTRGEVIVSLDRAGGDYYLTGRSYNLNASAADVWERKAAQMAGAAFTWSSDNMRVDKTGLRKEAIEMARYYRGLAGPVSISMERGDTDAY